MEKVLVSACLLGIPCRYDGKSVGDPAFCKMLNENMTVIPFCPEIYGGLPTPRTPAERVGERILTKDGKDVTSEYVRGAEEAVKLCRHLGIRFALLKSRSPSCGNGVIYDGTFSGALTEGSGVSAQMLRENGVEVYSSDEVSLLLQALAKQD